MHRGCMFSRACSGRGRGTNYCRLYTLSLLLNPVPQELKIELLDMDFSKEFTFEFAVQSHGCTKLNVMYTNDPDSVMLCHAEFKQYVQDEKAQGRRTIHCGHPFAS